MAIPLLLLGAAFSALAVNELAEDRVNKQLKRKRHSKVETLSDLAKYDSPIAVYPSDLLVSLEKSKTNEVTPKLGAVVCCGLGGVLDHTGIYIGDNTIVELAGNGLVKAVSMQRFLSERSGDNIFIACDSARHPLVNEDVAKSAIDQIYHYHEYDVIKNNCHRFIWQLFDQKDNELTTFKNLSIKLANYYNRIIYWDVCKVVL